MTYCQAPFPVASGDVWNGSSQPATGCDRLWFFVTPWNHYTQSPETSVPTVLPKKALTHLRTEMELPHLPLNRHNNKIIIQICTHPKSSSSSSSRNIIIQKHHHPETSSSSSSKIINPSKQKRNDCHVLSTKPCQSEAPVWCDHRQTASTADHGAATVKLHMIDVGSYPKEDGNHRTRVYIYTPRYGFIYIYMYYHHYYYVSFYL